MSPTEVSEEQITDIRNHVINSVPLMSVPNLQSAARRRQARNRVGMVAGAAVVTAAVVVGAYGLHGGQPRPQPQVPAAGEYRTDSVSLAGALKVQSLRPASVTHIYAVVELRPKQYALARSVDAGHTWASRLLPEPLQNGRWKQPPSLSENMPQAQPAAIVALAPDTVVIGSMITHDGGTTWTPAGEGGKLAPVDNGAYDDQVLAVGDPVRTVPKNWPVRLRFVQGAKLPSVDAVDPKTGVDHPLTMQPTTYAYNVKRVADGSLWVVGTDSQGVTGVQASHNNGQTWTKATVDDGMTNGYQEVASRDGHTAYLLGSPDSLRSGSGQPLPIGLRVSHDGGATWGARTPIGSSVFEMQNLVVLADGSLVGAGSVRAAGGTWQMLRSTDGGRTFNKIATLPADPSSPEVGNQPAGGPITAFPAGGYFFRTNGDASKGAIPATMVSADGISWKTVSLPPIR